MNDYAETQEKKHKTAMARLVAGVRLDRRLKDSDGDGDGLHRVLREMTSPRSPLRLIDLLALAAEIIADREEELERLLLCSVELQRETTAARAAHRRIFEAGLVTDDWDLTRRRGMEPWPHHPRTTMKLKDYWTEIANGTRPVTALTNNLIGSWDTWLSPSFVGDGEVPGTRYKTRDAFDGWAAMNPGRVRAARVGGDLAVVNALHAGLQGGGCGLSCPQDRHKRNAGEYAADMIGAHWEKHKGEALPLSEDAQAKLKSYIETMREVTAWD